MTQEEFAHTYVGGMERGELNVSPSRLEPLAATLRVDPLLLLVPPRLT